MERGAQTAIIIGAMVTFGGAYVVYDQKYSSGDPEDRCWTLACRAHFSAHRLAGDRHMGGSPAECRRLYEEYEAEHADTLKAIDDALTDALSAAEAAASK